MLSDSTKKDSVLKKALAPPRRDRRGRDRDDGSEDDRQSSRHNSRRDSGKWNRKSAKKGGKAKQDNKKKDKGISLPYVHFLYFIIY